MVTLSGRNSPSKERLFAQDMENTKNDAEKYVNTFEAFMMTPLKNLETIR